MLFRSLNLSAIFTPHSLRYSTMFYNNILSRPAREGTHSKNGEKSAWREKALGSEYYHFFVIDGDRSAFRFLNLILKSIPEDCLSKFFDKDHSIGRKFSTRKKRDCNFFEEARSATMAPNDGGAQELSSCAPPAQELSIHAQSSSSLETYIGGRTPLEGIGATWLVGR